MHLLVTNIFFEPFTYGGATVVAEEVVRELARQTDWKITVVSASSSLGIQPYTVVRTEGAGVTNIVIGLPPFLGGADAYLNANAEALFGQLLTSLAPDVVHAHCVQNIGAGPLRMAKSRDIPLVVSVHDFWWLCERQFMINNKGAYCGLEEIRPKNCASCVDNPAETRVRDEVLRGVLNDASVITYPSKFTRDLYERSGIRTDAGIVWQNGVHGPSAEFFDLQQKRRALDPRVSFGFVGGPSVIKGWPLMRKAFAFLDRDDFVVNVVDASADQSWWRPSDFDALPGEWRILPPYRQSTIDRFYSQIDVMLFLSQWKETFGLTLREAATRGLEIIQTAGGGTTEHPAYEDASVLEIGAGPQDIAKALSDVLEGPRRAQPCTVRGYAEQAEQLINIVGNL